MALKPEIIERIIERIQVDRGRFDTDARHAHSLGISKPVYSQILNGRYENKINLQGWLNIAFKLGVDVNEDTTWQIVKTPTFEYICTQLRACQDRSISNVLCDIPNIGKTVAAKYYARQNPNVAYVDCSEHKTKDRLIREITRQLGINDKGTYYNVYDRLIFNLRAIHRPLIILDEAGDLYHEAFLELKAYWNATENCCGWYMMGATGLKKKIERRVESDRVGYAEIFSRFGEEFDRVTPEEEQDRKKFIRHQNRIIAQGNVREGQNHLTIATKSKGARKVKSNITKPAEIVGTATQIQ